MNDTKDSKPLLTIDRQNYNISIWRLKCLYCNL